VVRDRVEDADKVDEEVAEEKGVESMTTTRVSDGDK
jgi:hypothetical protein